MRKIKYPTISVIIPFYNEAKNLKRLIPSLKKQSYPRNKIEYIFVDDQSTDSSLKLINGISRSKIVKVSTHDIELNKGVGMHAAKGELVYWLDADMEICCTDFFERLSRPLIDDHRLGASFTAEFSFSGSRHKVNSSILRFISYHPLQQDPLYDFFSPSLEKQVVEKRNDYDVMKFNPGKIPAVGRILYRRKKLISTKVGKMKSFIDMEAVEIYTRAGNNLYAYVPSARIRHYHAETLGELVRKRSRNLELDYLPNYGEKYFTWFDVKNPRDVIKIIFWVIWANLLFPEFIRGIIRSLKHGDIAFMWHPIVAFATTDAILWGFISRPKGRKIIFDLLHTLFLGN